MNPAIDVLNRQWKQHLETLKSLVRIPSVSFKGFPRQEVEKSAQAVAQLLKATGLENVEIMRLGDAHPYVYADWLHAPGKPTLLLYAHHDVQPPGREKVWQSPPFEPTVKEGPGGLRLYARGAADDKAGIIVHVAAIDAYLKAVGKLPLNVKVIIEGEEEIGSHHLGDFLKTHRKKLDADVLVLTDTANFDCGIPSLTVALRGMLVCGIELRALKNTVHSGMWGGPIPDPAMALNKLLSSLVDDRGQLSVPEIISLMPPLTPEESRAFTELPFDEARFREQSGMVDGAQILRQGPSPFAQLWRYPSVAVNAMEVSSRQQAGNIISDCAWARISLRLAPGMDAQKAKLALERHLKKQTPWGLELKLEGMDDPVNGWMTQPKGPAFDAAREALLRGYGRPAVMMGCGGTIPFVQPFADALGGAPALLIGVEDPFTNAHGENESLLIDDLRKACLSEVHLFELLADFKKSH